MPEEPKPLAEKFDFRRPIFLKEVELQHLRSLHEDFIRFLGARLSLFLRMEFSLKLTRLNTMSYGAFTGELAEVAHLCLFKAEPLTGIGLLDLNPSLALAIADRLLGGRGQAVAADRRLTEIEIGLIDDVILLILEEWCGQWKADPALRPLIVGYENDGRFLQTSPKDANLLTLRVEATFGEVTGAMQIAIPYYTIEPLVRGLRTRRQKEGARPAAARPPVRWHSAFDHVAVPMRAEWDGYEVSLREIACLRVGDVIELPESLLQQTRILLNGTPKFVGTIGLEGENVAVQIGHKLTID
jgi:flagellar motor switch protein FliM